MLSSVTTTRDRILGSARGAVGEGIVGEGTLCIVHGVYTVLVNVFFANHDGQVRGLCKVT